MCILLGFLHNNYLQLHIVRSKTSYMVIAIYVLGKLMVCIAKILHGHHFHNGVIVSLMQNRNLVYKT